MDVPHFFIQNKKVNEFNERVHNAATEEKLGANSAQLRAKSLSQISDDPRKTKKILFQTFGYQSEKELR